MSRRSFTLALLIGICNATTATAHEFWIQPSDYRLAPEQMLSLTLQVGDADRFNAYLRDEGLTPALEYRERTHQLHVDGYEKYSRRAKTILLVGSPDADARAHITKPLGLQLEIVPVANPYAIPRPASLPVRIIYEGKPLPGALVKLTDLERAVTAIDAQRTDDSGVATFTMPRHGTWLLSVVWTKRLTDAADADFETTFSSLTFGLPDS